MPLVAGNNNDGISLFNLIYDKAEDEFFVIICLLSRGLYDKSREDDSLPV